MVTPSIQINPAIQGFGPKTINLKRLQDLGLLVPSFVALSSSVVQQLWQNKDVEIAKLVTEIEQILPAQKYAIRSSALIEDESNSSMAGQFSTQTDIPIEQLGQAIDHVIIDAHKKLNGQLHLFSLIIQEFISAEYSGITFTRNPVGSREMVIEYYPGAGENVVGGKVTPITNKFYWNESGQDFLPGVENIIKYFKKVEQSLHYPQDIEWCLKDGSYYFLQSRPITTITKDQYDEFLFLGATLPKDRQFFYEKTEISEIAPRPTPFTLSLLRRIYQQGGPIDNVYRKHGVSYQEKDFLKIVGNELYVDRELELKTLLPAYTYFNSNFAPKLSGLNGVVRTFKNVFRLRLMNANVAILETAIKEKLENEVSSGNFSELLNNFLSDYELIFEINLLAEKAIKNLQFVLAKTNLNESTLLSKQPETNLNILFPAQNWQGNSLEIADLTPFSARVASNSEAEGKDLQALPQWRQLQIKPLLEKARQLNQLREFGRWLTVKHLNNLRNNIKQAGNFQNPADLFFATIEEFENNHLDQTAAENRRHQYNVFAKYDLPAVLQSTFIAEKTTKIIGVSPGQASGKLVAFENLDSRDEPAILYTKILSPSLVDNFPKLKGIVSEKGGVLSHLAIMARERKIPVVVNFNLSDSKIKLGDQISLDATASTITKIE